MKEAGNRGSLGSLTSLSATVINTVTKSNLGRETGSFILQLAAYHEGKAENLKAGTEAETMREYCFLV